MVKKHSTKKISGNKLFVVRKYVWASTADEAIKKERSISADDVWIDDDWKRNSNQPKDAIGFYVLNNDEE